MSVENKLYKNISGLLTKECNEFFSNKEKINKNDLALMVKTSINSGSGLVSNTHRVSVRREIEEVCDFINSDRIPEWCL